MMLGNYRLDAEFAGNRRKCLEFRWNRLENCELTMIKVPTITCGELRA